VSVLKRISIWIVILVPPTIFYLFWARSLKGLPVSDDYGAVLNYLLLWKSESGIKHIIQIITSQNNDYRLMFENAIYGIQYAILGHTNLKALAIMGDLFVIPLFAILYLMWRECGRPRDYTLLAFIPVSWLLFQLQYASALNNASAPLQLIPVVVFALLTCYLSTQANIMAFLGALLSLMLCVASSGNGLFMIPIGGIIFLQRRQYKKLMVWCFLSAIISLIYFHSYNFTVEMSHTHAHNNVLSLLQHMSPFFGAAFLGAIATAGNPLPAILFGSVLFGVFILATLDLLFVRRPALYYSSLFFVVTGIAVSGLRSSYGLATALGSRYRINSTVLVILLYLYLADKFYGVRLRPLVLRAGACIFGVLLLGFNFASDCAGAKLTMTMQHKVEAAILRWQRHEPRPAISASAPGDYTSYAENKGYYEVSDPILSESIREGIYKLPVLPTGN
jgi:hypothetical protein